MQETQDSILIARFSGKDGENALRDALMGQKIVLGNEGLTTELLKRVEIIATTVGQELIQQGASSHFSRTVITDMHRNRCDDSSTVHHREVRPSPETSASSASNHRLFDNHTEAVNGRSV
jgi:hypothetical protein